MPQTFPHRQLHPLFREAYALSKVRTCDVAPFLRVDRTRLSRLMWSADVPASPLNVARLERLARWLNYHGPVFR